MANIMLIDLFFPVLIDFFLNKRNTIQTAFNVQGSSQNIQEELFRIVLKFTSLIFKKV